MKTWYTYLIGWSTLGIYYYGYRGSTCDPQDDIWKKYFTSSKYVQNFRKLNGEPDVVRVDRVHPTKGAAIDYEDEFLRTNDAVRSNFWLNRCRRGVEFRSPDKYSEESRKRMSEARKRNGYTRKKPWTEEQREQSRQKLIYVNENGLRAPWTDERRNKISKSKTEFFERGGAGSRAGSKNSSEHNERISEKAKSRLANRTTCIVCQKSIPVSFMKRHIKSKSCQPI